MIVARAGRVLCMLVSFELSTTYVLHIMKYNGKKMYIENSKQTLGPGILDSTLVPSSYAITAHSENVFDKNF